MAKIGFIAIGETIEFDGIKAVAVSSDNRLSCKGCVFCDRDECPSTKGLTPCYFAFRKDRSNIEFKEI